MASKLSLITDLYQYTALDMSNSIDSWASFLTCASMNYKYSFSDQVLIYAQKPSAVACADIETWNQVLGRWVNKGAKGIALINEENGYSRLKYVFDVSDTNNKYGKNIALWKVSKNYEQEVIESLDNRYGELENKTTLAQAIISASKNMVEDNLTDYLEDLVNFKENSLLDNIGNEEVGTIFKETLANSIAYVMISRCGLNTSEYFKDDDFKGITYFNTVDTITRLGSATSDISEMGLRDIYTTLKNMQIEEINKIRTFENKNDTVYDNNDGKSIAERSDIYANNLHETRGLRTSELNIVREERADTREIRKDEIELSENKQESVVSDTTNERSINRPFERDRADDTTQNRISSTRYGSEGTSDGRLEDNESDEMGWIDEQPKSSGGRNSNQRINLHLDHYNEEERNDLSFLYDDDIIRGILKTTPHLRDSKKVITAYFENNLNSNERTEYVKGLFDNAFTEILLDDVRYGYKAYENGLYFWRGSTYFSKDAQNFFKWITIADYFQAMIILKEFEDRIEPIPSHSMQLSIMNEMEKTKNNQLTFSQGVIDIELQNGSRVQDGKFRIYEHLTSSLNKSANIEFLKHEYGTGGCSSIATGLGIGQNHGSKGIELYKGYGENTPKLLLKWNEVEKRLQELIKTDRYFSKQEKEQYPKWLEEQDNKRAKYGHGYPFPNEDVEEILTEEKSLSERIHDFEKDFNHYDYQDNMELDETEEDKIKETEQLLLTPEGTKGIINYLQEAKDDMDEDNDDRKLIDDFITELKELHPSYEYHLGDKVYIGIEEYEILSFDNETVRCYDYQYPLFNKEYTREEFDKKVRENPANDHLMVKEVEQIITNESTVEKTIIEEPIISGIDYSEYIEKVIEINDRKYCVEDIDSSSDKIELRDITFESTVGFPISRVDRLSNILPYLETTKEEIIPAFEKKTKSRVQTFDLHPEIKESDRNNFIITDNELGYGTPREKYARNIEAIKVLKLCEKENRFAIPEEQETLSKYIGWGGLSQVFDDKNSSWASEYLELKSLLDEDEYTNARESTLTAFFTPPTVIRAMYQALDNMGLKSGNILEPSCGVGNFLGMLPSGLSECKMYGVELDSISGNIARQLYQKSSIAVQGFEKTDLPDSFFDIAVGNVPFGDFKVLDKKYDKHKFLIHDYFFGKTLDKVRPGGIVCFITSKGTLDKETPTVRRYISQRADLLGAIRLPNNTFKNNAGTEVTADIIFLQKRDSITDIEPDWVYLDTNEDGIKMNRYFIENPEMILGEMEQQSTQYGFDFACKPIKNADLGSQLDEAISNIHAEIKDYALEDIGEGEDLSIPADFSVRNFSYTLVDNELYFRENSRMYPQELAVTTTNRVKGMIGIRDSVRNIIEMQTEDFPDSDIKIEQAKLNTLYDNFSKKYGLINSRANNSAFSNDSSYYLLCSLEVLDENGELLRKADMFSKRTIKAHKEITEVDTADESLVVSISEKAKVDIEFMSSLSGKREEELKVELEGVIFKLPMEDRYVTADEYLSGNVRDKLREARLVCESNSIYEINVKALETVQPEDLKPSEISVRLGATWLPTDDIQKFMYGLLETSNYARWNIKVHYSNFTGEWNVEGKNYDRGNVKAHTTYGTSRVNAYKIIEDTLNLKDVRVYDYVEDVDGKKQQILNKKETAIAQAKQEQIKTAFDEWIWNDQERRERLTILYNEKFNSIRPREYDGSHITFGGINPEISLREHQVNAIARILYGGNTLLAHEVGAGKTFEMVAAAMESKRLGLCSKSLIVVPNHIIEQFAGEFLQLYPTANILVSTKKDFETVNRKKFCSRIATGDFDAVIIGHSQFEKIPMSVERQRIILQKQIDDITFGVNDLKKNRGENFSIKQLEKTKKGIQNRLEKLNDQSRKDSVVTFEELGVDRIFIDEAHYYKNLFLYTKMRNVGGIAQTEAQKSSDLYMKCQYLDELTGGKGITFATGTPISNSMVELYTMQRYLQSYTLERNNLPHFDSWASTFGETVTAIELAPEGTGYRAKTRFAKFYNLPELMNMFKEVADIQTQDMLNLPVPKANYHNVVIKPSPIQVEMVKELSERADRVRNKMVDSSTDNMLKITNDGRKLALDQRLVNDMLEDFEDSKISVCANNIFNIWKDNEEKKLTQLVFCDLSTPKSDGSFNVYDDLKKKLLNKGIPSEEVAFIHDADNEVKKKELFVKVRQGKIRVLMGSTQKMGAGTNCQDKLIALHDLDCPWRPSDLIQRSGRIIRQGNKNPEVGIYRYVTEKTFDAYLFQLVENKQRFISQIMTSKSPVRSAEDIDETALSYAEIKALAAGNPLILEKTELDTGVAKLKLLKQSHLSQIYSIEDRVVKYYPSEIKRLEVRIEGLKRDLEVLKVNSPSVEDKFQKMILNGKIYTDKTEAGKVIIESCKAMTKPDPILLGEYRGFKMELSFDSTSREFNIYMKNNLSHNVRLGSDVHGNITRIDNVLDSLENRLKDTEISLEDTKKQFENAKIEIGRPFPKEEELKAKTKRLDELNILLNMNQKDKDIIDNDPSDTEDSQMYKKDYER